MSHAYLSPHIYSSPYLDGLFHLPLHRLDTIPQVELECVKVRFRYVWGKPELRIKFGEVPNRCDDQIAPGEDLVDESKAESGASTWIQDNTVRNGGRRRRIESPPMRVSRMIRMWVQTRTTLRDEYTGDQPHKLGRLAARHGCIRAEAEYRQQGLLLEQATGAYRHTVPDLTNIYASDNLPNTCEGQHQRGVQH